jgi:hypothetical protein
VEPFEEKGMGNTPPMLRFDPADAVHTDPPSGIATSPTASVAQPLELNAWVTDKPAKIVVKRAARPDLALTWALGAAPRSRRRHVQQREPDDRQNRGWQNDDHGHIPRAGRLRPARAGGRRLRRRRRPVSVLLDERARQSHGQTGRTKVEVLVTI